MRLKKSMIEMLLFIIVLDYFLICINNIGMGFGYNGKCKFECLNISFSINVKKWDQSIYATLILNKTNLSKSHILLLF